MLKDSEGLLTLYGYVKAMDEFFDQPQYSTQETVEISIRSYLERKIIGIE